MNTKIEFTILNGQIDQVNGTQFANSFIANIVRKEIPEIWEKKEDEAIKLFRDICAEVTSEAYRGYSAITVLLSMRQKPATTEHLIYVHNQLQEVMKIFWKRFKIPKVLKNGVYEVITTPENSLRN